MSRARTRMEKAMYRAFAGAVVLAAAIGLALVWSAATHAAPLRIPGIRLGVDPAAGRPGGDGPAAGARGGGGRGAAGWGGGEPAGHDACADPGGPPGAARGGGGGGGVVERRGGGWGEGLG